MGLNNFGFFKKALLWGILKNGNNEKALQVTYNTFILLIFPNNVILKPPLQNKKTSSK